MLKSLAFELMDLQFGDCDFDVNESYNACKSTSSNKYLTQVVDVKAVCRFAGYVSPSLAIDTDDV